MKDKSEALKSAVDSQIFVGLPVRDIQEACYTLSEGYQFPDEGTVSADQMIFCWKVVQYILRVGALPEEFRL